MQMLETVSFFFFLPNLFVLFCVCISKRTSVIAKGKLMLLRLSVLSYNIHKINFEYCLK